MCLRRVVGLAMFCTRSNEPSIGASAQERDDSVMETALLWRCGFFFTESAVIGDSLAKEGDAKGDGNGNSGGTGSEVNDDTDNHDDELTNRTRAECKKKQAYALWAGDLTSSGKGKTVNGSGSISAPSTKIEDDSGLSHTQLVVIVTCSCIIGLFFFVAGIMRIRNYVNRLREEQAMAKRPTFRSCTVALRNSTGSSELLRRETLSNTSPSKGEDDRNSGGGESIQSSPKQAGNANNPKFLTTSASPKQEANKSSLKSPTSSIKYIDEDDTSKKESDTDEVEDEGESESKPLLASEVLSGKEDNRENGKGPVHFGNALAFENFPNNNNNAIPNTTDTNEANLNPSFSSMENNSYQPTAQSEPEVSWLEQAVEESTIGSVTAGLTQSDSSLSSGNKFYSYGNGQLEYVVPYQPQNGDGTSASSSSLSSPGSDKSPAITLSTLVGDGDLSHGNVGDEPLKTSGEVPHSDVCDNQTALSFNQNQSVPEDNAESHHIPTLGNASQDPSLNRPDNSMNTDNNCNNNPNDGVSNNVTTNSTTPTTEPSSSNPVPKATEPDAQTKSVAEEGNTERGVVLVDVEGNYTHQTKEPLPQKATGGEENRREQPLPTSSSNATTNMTSTTTTTTTSASSPHHSTASSTSSPKAIPNVIAGLPPMASRDTEYL